jgi:hypothetical protein
MKSSLKTPLLAAASTTLALTSVSFVQQLRDPAVGLANGWTNACDDGYNTVGPEACQSAQPCSNDWWAWVQALCSHNCECEAGAILAECGEPDCIELGACDFEGGMSDVCGIQICP